MNKVIVDDPVVEKEYRQRMHQKLDPDPTERSRGRFWMSIELRADASQMSGEARARK